MSCKSGKPIQDVAQVIYFNRCSVSALIMLEAFNRPLLIWLRNRTSCEAGFRTLLSGRSWLSICCVSRGTSHNAWSKRMVDNIFSYASDTWAGQFCKEKMIVSSICFEQLFSISLSNDFSSVERKQ